MRKQTFYRVSTLSLRIDSQNPEFISNIKPRLLSNISASRYSK